MRWGLADEDGVVEGPGSDMVSTVVEYLVKVVCTADRAFPTHVPARPLFVPIIFFRPHGFSRPLFVP